MISHQVSSPVQDINLSNEKCYIRQSGNLACGDLLVLRRVETEEISYKDWVHVFPGLLSGGQV